MTDIPLCSQDIIKNQSMSVRVRPISANLTHDTELIDRMDPYCKIYFGGQQFRTQVCEFGGKTPQWSDTFILNPCGDSTLRVEVWDHDSVNDDLVGAGTFNIQGVFGNPNMGSRNEYVDLFYKGRSAGRVLLCFDVQNMMGGYGSQPMTGQVGWNGNMQQPMMGGQMQGGWGVQQPPMMNGGYGIQPPMQPMAPMGNQWGNMPPPNNGWGGNMPPPNNGWGNPPNNGWGGW